jgi:hypothetical protein
MDGNLQLKTVSELKELLKNQNLPVSGKKQDLIDRLIANKPRQSKTYDTYLDLLPGDIQRELLKYRLENEPNNKVFVSLLTDRDIIYNFTDKPSYFTKTKTTFKRFFLENNLSVEIEKHGTTGRFKIGQLPIIEDNILQKLILLLTKEIRSSFEIINTKLKKYNNKWRIISYWNRTDLRTFEFIKID